MRIHPPIFAAYSSKTLFSWNKIASCSAIRAIGRQTRVLPAFSVLFFSEFEWSIKFSGKSIPLLPFCPFVNTTPTNLMDSSPQISSISASPMRFNRKFLIFTLFLSRSLRFAWSGGPCDCRIKRNGDKYVPCQKCRWYPYGRCEDGKGHH